MVLDWNIGQFPAIVTTAPVLGGFSVDFDVQGNAGWMPSSSTITGSGTVNGAGGALISSASTITGTSTVNGIGASGGKYSFSFGLNLFNFRDQ